MNIRSVIIGLLFLLAACGGGSAQARIDYALAMQYLQGVGVPQDEAKGLELLKKASDERYPEAETMLGFYLMKGSGGMQKDEAAGMKLFLDAADQGYRDAQYNAGLAYIRAQGVEENFPEALQWFTAAALQGDPGAQYNLGVMHFSGEGTQTDALTAYAWFAIAAENGYEGASEGQASAKEALTSEQALQTDATVSAFKKKIVKPPEQEGMVLPSMGNLPL